MKVQWLGRLPFEEALAIQEEKIALRKESALEDELLLLEHEPVYTIGRNPDQSSLLNKELLMHPVVQINRGGKATYHGPGQLVGYPIIDLKRKERDLHLYLRTLEEFLIELLSIYKIPARQRPELTGVWVDNRKIASIGVGVRHWVTMHGFALNVCGDLSPFQQIVPCGISGVEITSIEKEISRSIDVKKIAEDVADLFPGWLER